jgi:peptide deformylase
MAVRKITYQTAPDASVLRKKAVEVKNVDKLITQLLDDMVETMYSANGIGLAAPQIGLSKRLIVADIGDGPIKLINPKILTQEGAVWGLEGCLSIPNVYGEVERAEKVTVRYMDEKGKMIKREADGLLARVFQHEIDHLDGKLFTDVARNVREYTPEELEVIGDPERAEPAMRG